MNRTKRFRVWLQAKTEYVATIDAIDEATAKEAMLDLWFNSQIEPYDEHSGTVEEIEEVLS